MPLTTSTSKQAFSANVVTEVNAGKPQAQAVAIAYSEKRKAQAEARKKAKRRKANR
jgi:hypothetical protein